MCCGFDYLGLSNPAVDFLGSLGSCSSCTVVRGTVSDLVNLGDYHVLNMAHRTSRFVKLLALR
jgi:hypothetical protein